MIRISRMIGRWLSWLNGLIIIAACLLLGGASFVWLNRPAEIIYNRPVSSQYGLPKNGFSISPEAYSSIGEPLLALQSAVPTLQLPDLRHQLIYYGKNGRPDAQSKHTWLHFSLAGNKTIVSISPKEPLYLVYDKKMVPSHYVFSPNNKETSLWIEAYPQDNEAVIKVVMKTDKGELITEPEQCGVFKLAEKEFIRHAGAGSWEIGTWRVDGTLLARQKVRWYGLDRFLERHGGEEYQSIVGKQRIDFGENEELYSVFVKVGDCLIWEGNRWKSVTPGETSLNYPLLVVKKVDERLMSFELWDIEGKGKVLLNILKSAEPWMMHNTNSIQHMFKFAGARTRTQCVFEVNHERMIISPSDWLLMTSKGWKKLSTEEEIDHYVKRKTLGTLFVFEGLGRKEDRQVLFGTLYNSSRSDFQELEVPLQQGLKSTVVSKEKELKGSESEGRVSSSERDEEESRPVPLTVPTITPVYPIKEQPISR